MRQTVAKKCQQAPVGVAAKNPQAAKGASGVGFEAGENAITAEKEILSHPFRAEGRAQGLGLDHGDGDEAETIVRVQRQAGRQ